MANKNVPTQDMLVQPSLIDKGSHAGFDLRDEHNIGVSKRTVNPSYTVNNVTQRNQL